MSPGQVVPLPERVGASRAMLQRGKEPVHGYTVCAGTCRTP